MWKLGREAISAGAYIQRIGTTVDSFTGINVSSLATLANATVSSLTGGAGWRGISQLNSGVAATSVQATAAQSGAVIQVTPYNYLSAIDSFTGIQVWSVGAGFFNVKAINSIAPTSLMPFAWSVVR